MRHRRSDTVWEVFDPLTVRPGGGVVHSNQQRLGAGPAGDGDDGLGDVAVLFPAGFVHDQQQTVGRRHREELPRDEITDPCDAR